MAVFTFPNHAVGNKYPESGTKVQFGRGYEFVSAPRAPDQTIYTLNFQVMKFFVNPNGTLDLTTNPEINMAVLDNFYKTHRLYEKFTYPHPLEGNVIVRFNKPLTWSIKEKGLGTVDPFTIELRYQP